MNPTAKNIWLRRIVLLLGTSFVVVSVVAGYVWLYRLGPVRRLVDPRWRELHSHAAIWAEEQTDYRRNNSSPDLFFRGDAIGYYGDKEWALWLLHNLNNDKNFRHCGCTQAALHRMTNQQVAEGTDRWLEKHEGESQEQWIQQGFQQFGATVHLPPTAEDYKVLLPLLGDREKNAEGEAKIPEWLKYNAFRWLRDSGFNWSEYTVEHPEWRADERLAAGVCCYASLESKFPSYDGIGRLAFSAKRSSTEDDWFVSPLIKPGTIAMAHGIIFGALALGAAMFIIASRMKKQFRSLPTT